MATVLIASDAEWVHQDVRSVLPSDAVVESVGGGRQVVDAVLAVEPDLAVIDLQIGSMGGFATCLELRLEESGGRLPHIPVLLLLDRRADVFLARRAAAEGWLVKPLDPIRVRRAVEALLAGGTYHDESFRPTPVLVD
ncbi:MAG TPA: response regulator [Acidimicrobiales bacterium]|nr:response regulator [Acidimicrobiales bacterium]